VEEGGHRGAVLLQEPQEGDRPVQAPHVGPSGGRPRCDRRGPREDVRLPVRPAPRHRNARRGRPLRPAAAPVTRPAAPGGGGRARRSGGRRMSERGAGFGPFLLGLGLGAVLGFLFAPEPGEASRTKLSRKLRGLRDLAAEKAGELGELLDTDDEEDEPTARVAIERRLTEAKRRRRGGKGTSVEEEDEPVA